MTVAEIKRNVIIGNKYDILCKDGLNYIIEIKEFDSTNCHGHFHYPGWGAKYDYIGSFENLYLAKEGTYTTEGLLVGNNTYQTSDANGSNEVVVKQAVKRVLRQAPLEGAQAKRTRYEEDFLLKPRLSLRRKRDDDTQESVPPEALPDVPKEAAPEPKVEAKAPKTPKSKQARTKVEPLPPPAVLKEQEPEVVLPFALVLPTYFTVWLPPLSCADFLVIL